MVPAVLDFLWGQWIPCHLWNQVFQGILVDQACQCHLAHQALPLFHQFLLGLGVLLGPLYPSLLLDQRAPLDLMIPWVQVHHLLLSRQVIQLFLWSHLAQGNPGALLGLGDQAFQGDLVFQEVLMGPEVQIRHLVLPRHLFQADRANLLVLGHLGYLCCLDLQVLLVRP